MSIVVRCKHSSVSTPYRHTHRHYHHHHHHQYEQELRETLITAVEAAKSADANSPKAYKEAIGRLFVSISKCVGFLSPKNKVVVAALEQEESMEGQLEAQRVEHEKVRCVLGGEGGGVTHARSTHRSCSQP